MAAHGLASCADPSLRIIFAVRSQHRPPLHAEPQAFQADQIHSRLQRLSSHSLRVLCGVVNQPERHLQKHLDLHPQQERAGGSDGLLQAHLVLFDPAHH